MDFVGWVFGGGVGGWNRVGGFGWFLWWLALWNGSGVAGLVVVRLELVVFGCCVGSVGAGGRESPACGPEKRARVSIEPDI